MRRYLTGVSSLVWPSNTCSSLEMFLLLVSYNPDLLRELIFGVGGVSLECLGDPLPHRDLNRRYLNSSYHVFLTGRTTARQGKGNHFQLGGKTGHSWMWEEMSLPWEGEVCSACTSLQFKFCRTLWLCQ